MRKKLGIIFLCAALCAGNVMPAAAQNLDAEGSTQDNIVVLIEDETSAEPEQPVTEEIVEEVEEPSEESENAEDAEIAQEEDAEDEEVDTEEEDTEDEEVDLMAYSYVFSYVDLKQSTVGGVPANELVNKTVTVINQHEGGYGSIVGNDNGAVSVGKMMWNGPRALVLFKTIISANNQAAYDILTSKLGATAGKNLYTEITSATEVQWNTRTFSDSTQLAALSALLDSPQGHTCQDKLAYSDVAGYMNDGLRLGIQNPAALLYFADITNQTGLGNQYVTSAGSRAVALMAKNIAGSWDKVTLNEMYQAAICFTYDGGNVWARNNKSLFLSLRRSVYKYASEQGWTYKNAGDFLMPYNSSTGIEWVQHALNVYQNAGLTVDGNMGTKTVNAIKAFQTANGLSATGTLTNDTTALLVRNMYTKRAQTGSGGVVTVTSPFKGITMGCNVDARTSYIKVAWTKQSVVEGYNVYRKEVGGSWSKIATIKSNATVSYCDKGAVAGKTYLYCVRGYQVEADGSVIRTAYKESQQIKLATVKVKPTCKANASSIDVSWTAVSGASGYIVYRKTADTSWKQIADVTSATTVKYTDTKATKGTPYFYAVRAYKKDTGNGLAYIADYSSSAEVQIAATEGAPVSGSKDPAAYKEPTATLQSGKTMSANDVMWLQASLSQVGYWKNSIDGKWNTALTTAVKNYQTAAGLSVDGAVGASTRAALKADTKLAQTVSKCTATADTNKMTITWSKITNAQGYYVYRKAVGGSWEVIKTITNGATVSYADTKGTNGTKYYYTVRGYKKLGSVTLKTKYEATKAVTYTASGSTTPEADASTDPAAYTVPTATLQSGKTMSSNDVKWLQASLYQLKYYTGTVDGKWSTNLTAAVKKFQTDAKLTVDGVVGPSTRGVLNDFNKVAGTKMTCTVTPGTNKVTVTWKAAALANGYFVYRRTGEGSWEALKTITGTTTLSYVDSTATSSNTYSYMVRAYHTVGSVTGSSGYTASASVRPTASAVVTDPKNPSMYTVPTTTLSEGRTMSANDVKWLQACLTKAGYYTGSIDGKWTSSFTAIVKKYQTNAGLTPDGVVGSATRSNLQTYMKLLNTKETCTAVGGAGKITLSWPKVSDAQGYYLYRKVDGGSWAVLKTITNNTTLTYTDTSAVKGTTYYYAVRGYRISGNVLMKTAYSSSKAAKRTS